MENKCKNECRCTNYGWTYECNGVYKLKSDLTSEIESYNFIVKFDGRHISTRFLYEPPTYEDCEDMLQQTKNDFYKKIGINL